MAMFSNDVRVVNTATPAFRSEPNVTQYGWTKSDAAYYNQLIQYVDEARQIYEYVSEKVIYFDGVLSKLANIEDVIDFMVQKGNEVADDAREVRAATAYVSQTKNAIDIMYRNFNADYIIFNSKYADMNIKYDAILKVGAQVHQDSVETHQDYLATKALYDDLKEGQVYRGVWNPKINAYPDAGGTNSTWDVVLDFGTTTIDFDSKTWRSGDRLIYSQATSTHYQINTGSGVDRVNGYTGSVILDANDVDALPIDGGTLEGTLQFEDDKKFISVDADDLTLAAQDGKVYIQSKTDPIAKVGSQEYKFYHEGKKPTPVEINAVGISGNYEMSGSLTAAFFRAKDAKAFVSNARENQGLFMDLAGANHRTMIGGGGGKADITGEVYIRPNGFTEAQGQTVFTAFGQISNPVDPQTDSHLTNKKYVDLVTKAEAKPATGEGLLMRVGGPRDQAIDVALAGATGGAYVSETAPANPFQGARWFDTNDGRTYIYFDDGDSKQWVEENPQSASETLTNPIIVQLAQEGTLDVADGKKNAITVNAGSSISMQDNPVNTVFHNFAEGNGIEWAHGNLAENTLMTLDANGILHTKGPVFSAEGHVVESEDLKTWVSMEAINGVDPYIATKSQGETSVRKAVEFTPRQLVSNKEIFVPRVHITADGGAVFAPENNRNGVTWGMGINSTARSLGIHRYADGVWQQAPLEFSSSGASTFNSTVFVNGSIATNQGYVQVNKAANPMLELHSPGNFAAIMYAPGSGRLRFGQSNGAGGEVAWWSEMNSAATHFIGCVRPTAKSVSWTQFNDNVGGMVDREVTKHTNAGEWWPMITSSAYVHPTAGYQCRWSLGYYKDAAAHHGSVILQMAGDGALANNQKLHIMAGGDMIMDSTHDGHYWDIRGGGLIGGTVFGTYANMANWCNASFAPISDEKLKQNIQSSTASALDNVAKIKFHSYDWVDGTTKSTKIGMVAQELEAIDPSYAHDIETFKPDGSVDTSVKALDTANLLSLALKSIQELEARIKELEEKVNG